MSKELVIKDQCMLSSWDGLIARAEFLAKSSLLPAALRGKPADVAVILQMGWELGIPPMQAVNGIDVIQGKPCVSPQLAVALIRSRVQDAVIKYVETSETRAVVVMARDSKSLDQAYTATWDIEKAKKMGLAGKDNYIKQPGNMLKWRAVGEAARVIFPDVLKGFYLDGEIIDGNDDDDPNKSKIKTIESVINGKTETMDAKEVSAEVVSQAEPIVEQPTESPIAEDAGEYQICFGHKNKGKKFKDMTPKEVSAYAAEVRSSLERMKHPPEPMHNEFFEKANAYVSAGSAS